MVAPTAYGKTRASPVLHHLLRGQSLVYGLVHVAPLRSLVASIYRSHFQVHGGAVQMHEPPPGAPRSPYMLHRSGLIATTLDSFLWNLYRFPVAELAKIQDRLSMGHYYPALLAVHSSLVVFDEAHMMLSEASGSGARGVEAFTAALSYLRLTMNPLIVETATLHPRLLGQALQRSRPSTGEEQPVEVHAVAEPGTVYSEELGKAGERGGWSLTLHPAPRHLQGLQWETSIEDGWTRALREAASLAGEGLVLLVANTVGRAVELYREASRLTGDTRRLVLLHGRLATRDRREAEERLHRLAKEGQGLVVATQVVEAGVDVNASAVYTEAAPVENLVQRAGRACRRGAILERCRRQGGRVVIVDTGDPGPYPRAAVEEALKLVAEAGCVDWRSPSGSGACTGYPDLIASAAPPKLPGTSFGDVARYYLESDAPPWALVEAAGSEVLCGLYRSTGMVGVYAGPGNGWVTASLEDVATRLHGLMKTDSGGAPVLVAVDENGDIAARAGATGFEEAARRGRRCGNLLMALRSDLKRLMAEVGAGLYRWGFEAAAYQPGLGLV